MNVMKKWITATAVCASMVLAGCAPDEELNESAEEIIGGVSAFSPKLNAIGTIGFLDDDGNYGFMCTATLIGPSTVLTAKHCTIDLDFGLGKLVNLVPLYFAVGPDAWNPQFTVELVAADVSPAYGRGPDQFGMVGLGSDVGVYHTIRPVTEVAPMKIAGWNLADRHLGWRYSEIGYGSQDLWEDLTGAVSATRKLGTGTLNALKGQAFQLMYDGDKDRFFYDLAQNYGPDIVEEYKDILEDWWAHTPLYQGYEAWVGNQPGDAQTCHGDSGGPLVRKYKKTGENLIYGVVSGGWYSADMTCAYGTFYATFGDLARKMIEENLKWTDPCRSGDTLLDANGVCDGTVARRCSDKWEGDRRSLVVDCASLDLQCGVSDTGRVACVDSEGQPADPEPVRGTPPTLEQVRSQVVRASRGEYSAKMKPFYSATNH